MEIYKNKILTSKERCSVRNRWLKIRLQTILPRIMSESDIDMWIVADREGNQDPVVKSFLPAELIASTRLTCFIFVKTKGHIDCLSLFGHESGFLSEYYRPCWHKGEESQWQCLKRIVDTYEPRKIGLNYSSVSSFGDGLSKSLYDEIMTAIGDGYAPNVTSADELCVKWYEERCDEEIVAYEGIDNIINGLIDEIFSVRTIHAGITTTEDLRWLIADRICEYGFNMNFLCDVDLQRKGSDNRKLSGVTIMPGDLLRCDVGFEYLGLNVDIQRQLYIPYLHEFDVPWGLKSAYEKVRRFQLIIAGQFGRGKTGNEIFSDAVNQAKDEGIRAELYIHPIGLSVHSAGPIMGLWDVQGAISGRGDYAVRDRTCYAVEFFVDCYIAEWEQNISLYAEQLMVFKGGKALYYNGLHEQIMLLKQKYF